MRKGAQHRDTGAACLLRLAGGSPADTAGLPETGERNGAQSHFRDKVRTMKLEKAWGAEAVMQGGQGREGAAIHSSEEHSIWVHAQQTDLLSGAPSQAVGVKGGAAEGW